MKRAWSSSRSHQTLLFGIAVTVVSILSVVHMQLELLTEANSKLQAAAETTAEVPSPFLSANSTTSRRSRFTPRPKKNRTSGGRIDTNTPTVIPVHPPPNNISLPLSVSFRGVAGLGHRLLRQSNAYHLAKGLYLDQLQIDWGWCYYADNAKNTTGQADIAPHLFGTNENGATIIPVQRQQATSEPQLPLVSFPFIKAIQWKNDDLLKQRQNQNPAALDFVNEVTHYNERQYSLAKMLRQEPKFYGKDQSDLEMYQTLVKKFQERHPRVQQWKDRLEFDQHTVIGLHIRLGNGETGDFRNKRRGIQGVTEDEWVSNLAKVLLNFTATAELGTDPSSKPPMIFLATDSSNVTRLVTRLQQSLKEAAGSFSVVKAIPKVLTIQQPRIPAGKGVSYQYMFDSKDSCLEGWVDQMTNMILLAESDVMIAGQYSSFTQTIPLSYQFEKARKRKSYEQNTAAGNVSLKSYPSSGLFCNVRAYATKMECFDDFGDWMMGKSSLVLMGDPNGEKQDFINLITMPIHTMMLRDMLKRRLRALPVDIVSLV